MLASLSSYCQYPTVKTIGKDTVVLMTLKQADDINKNFSILKDSLKTYDIKNRYLQDTLNVIHVEKNKLSSNIVEQQKNLDIKDVQILLLQSKLSETEKIHQSEKIKWAGWMFLSFVVTVLVGALK